MTAQEYFELGCNYQKEGKLHDALSCFLKAEELDPQSPAVEARKMLESIFNFYCKDIYNP